MELFIKVYETCTKCKGIGWIDEDPNNVYCESDVCTECCCGAIERFVRISNRDKRVHELYQYLSNMIKKGKFKTSINEEYSS